jgi:succinate dehydrogenase/fumarate reductase flavoprotein subunit
MVDEKLPQNWDEEADIVIVGSGFAGLAAAIEAKGAGSSVIILEKMKGYGGNSTISDGVIAAAATQIQADSEIVDSPQRIRLISVCACGRKCITQWEAC